MWLKLIIKEAICSDSIWKLPTKRPLVHWLESTIKEAFSSWGWKLPTKRSLVQEEDLTTKRP